MGRDFYPFVEENGGVSQSSKGDEVLKDDISYPARIAVYDDPSVTPRVVVIEPTNVRDFLASITETVTKLAQGQGGTIPFTIIRELVENFIHAKFIEPTITILDGGNTIRFCDQGPGIKEKDQALQFGTTSATDDMKHYIRGVGSGLPIAQQYMIDKGGSLTIQDNINGGTIVTISTRPQNESQIPCVPHTGQGPQANQNVEQNGEVAGPDGQAMNPAMGWDQAWQAQQGQPSQQGQYGVPQQPGFAAPGQGQTAYQQPYAQQPYDQQAWQQPWQQGSSAQNPYGQQTGNPYAGQWQQAAGWAQPQGSAWAQGWMPAPGQAPVQPGMQPGMQPQAPDGMVPGGDPRFFSAGVAGTAGAMGAMEETAEQGGADAMANPFASIQVSARGSMILGYLSTHESVGGIDLVNQYGGSQPTWSRELKVLDEKGLTRKEGQKRRLTDIGRAYLASLAG